MALFLATPLTENRDRLDHAIAVAIHESDRYRTKSGTWIIKFEGTSRELSDKVGTTNTEPTRTESAMYTPISGYYGRGPTDMWEWMKSRLS